MNQKQLILSVLEKLKPYRDMADIFIKRIDTGMYDEGFLEKLSISLQQAMKKVKGLVEYKKFEKASNILKKIQLQEDKEGDISEAEVLLEDI